MLSKIKSKNNKKVSGRGKLLSLKKSNKLSKNGKNNRKSLKGNGVKRKSMKGGDPPKGPKIELQKPAGEPLKFVMGKTPIVAGEPLKFVTGQTTSSQSSGRTRAQNLALIKQQSLPLPPDTKKTRTQMLALIRQRPRALPEKPTINLEKITNSSTDNDIDPRTGKIYEESEYNNGGVKAHLIKPLAPPTKTEILQLAEEARKPRISLSLEKSTNDQKAERDAIAKYIIRSEIEKQNPTPQENIYQEVFSTKEKAEKARASMNSTNASKTARSSISSLNSGTGSMKGTNNKPKIISMQNVISHLEKKLSDPDSDEMKKILYKEQLNKIQADKIEKTSVEAQQYNAKAIAASTRFFPKKAAEKHLTKVLSSNTLRKDIALSKEEIQEILKSAKTNNNKYNSLRKALEKKYLAKPFQTNNNSRIISNISKKTSSSTNDNNTSSTNGPQKIPDEYWV